MQVRAPLQAPQSAVAWRASEHGLGPGSPAQAAEAQAKVFEEILDAESTVDLAKLREAAQLGVPASCRGVVYRYLLGVSSVNKSSEMSIERLQEKDFEALRQSFTQCWAAPDAEPRATLLPRSSSTVPLIGPGDSRASHAARVQGRGTRDTLAAWEASVAALRREEPYRSSPARCQRLVAALEAMRVVLPDASPAEAHAIVALATPLEAAAGPEGSARDIFLCVQHLHRLLSTDGGVLQDSQSLQQHTGRFLMLFRAVNPVLCLHFARQGVRTLEWAPGMLTTLLAGRLHVDDLLRLWDGYLAAAAAGPALFALHPFVVLALLADLTEELIEVERAEILHRLQHLPRVDVPAVVRKANSIQESVYSKGIL